MLLYGAGWECLPVSQWLGSTTRPKRRGGGIGKTETGLTPKRRRLATPGANAGLFHLAPVVTNTGTWQNVSDCRNAADAAAFGQKHARGTASINLFHLRAQVRFRASHTVTEALNRP